MFVYMHLVYYGVNYKTQSSINIEYYSKGYKFTEKEIYFKNKK